jgi:NADPH:quinone reductase-like Zn-dependent oxidoreductase
MYGVTLREYGDESKLKLEEGLTVPEPKSNQVLVKVSASSVNPLDLMKREGYGKSIFEKQRKNIFPWIIGSDFSGTVAEIGSNISQFKIGDEVWGCSSNASSGTHAEYACIDVDEITHKPSQLDHLHAASLPYVAQTTWSAIIRWAGLRPQDLKEKKVFIQGGAGGVGCFSIQLFKSMGCEIATTCSEKNIELVKSLGADRAIDYNKSNFEEELSDYDIAYDLLGDHVSDHAVEKCCSILKKTADSHYITLTHPFVRTIDNKGILLGAPHALYLRQLQKRKFSPINIHWSIYRPSLSGLEQLTELVQDGTIKPIIDSVFKIEDIGQAHRKAATGHVSGKVIIEHQR